MNSLANFLNKKAIGILGYGREGQSSLQYIRKYNPQSKIIIFEDKEIGVTDKEVDIFPFAEWPKFKSSVDIFLKSPGLPWTPSFYSDGVMITSQTELFMEFALGKKIGITGSAGKSSTTSFTYEILRQNNRHAFIGGNFGIPLFDFIDELKDDSISVVELSSFQLKPLKKDPDISIFLNFYPDHLDYHKTIQDYFDSKCNIYLHQTKSDLLITNLNLLEKLPGIKSRVQTVSNQSQKVNAYIDGLQIKLFDKSQFSLEKFKPRGIGYRSNLASAILAVKELGVTNEEINKVIPLLSTPPHRLENIGICRGVQFYNDSISTIPETAIHAIKSIEEADSIIIGGFDRGLDQELLLKELTSNNKFLKIVCMGQTGKKIYALIKPKLGDKVFQTDILQEAVESIINTSNVKCCLFSPGAPSFGLFKNFEDRGQKLKETIQKINNI